MLKTYKTNNMVGTVGARLHYTDNTVQHDGVFIFLKQSNKNVYTTHKNVYAYYNYNTEISEVFGNTAALMMIKKDLFNSVGMFNESYRHCFEDVDLNLSTKIRNYSNYINGKCVAYHLESKTRNVDETETESTEDYNNILFPKIRDNFNKIKNQIFITN
jgi:GT2 family glycosyltransferase